MESNKKRDSKVTEIQKIVAKELKKKEEEIILEIPKDILLGDYAFPCFLLAKEKRQSPILIAKELAENLQKKNKYNDVEKIVATGPYVNFFINKKNLAAEILIEIAEKKEKYGSGTKKKERVMVEFSQANTHKAFHVGHVRGTSVGESLARIFAFLGYKTIRANYQGDTGAHVAKWLWCYLKYHKDDKYDKHTRAEWMAQVYVDAVKRLEENEKLNLGSKEINRKLEAREDSELMKLWQKTRSWSLEEFESVYKDLNTFFDHYFFESEAEELARDIVDRMVEKGIAEIDDGAAIIRLDKHNTDKKNDLGVFVLLRSDRTALYSSKDLALAELKFNKYKIDKSIYVVGAAQTHHLKQVFKTLEIIGFKQAKLCQHVAFAEVRLPTGKMSSRTGDNILYKDMKQMVFDYTREETIKRHAEWKKEKVESAVNAISIAAIKFDMLSRDNNKPIVFDIKRACDFEGETGPYIQYTNARINSIVRKYHESNKESANKENKLILNISADINFSVLGEKEQKLVALMSNFSKTVQETADNLKTILLTRYVLDLCQEFNVYYHATPVLKAENHEITRARILLVYAVGIIIKNCLNLLGIDAPEEM